VDDSRVSLIELIPDSRITPPPVAPELGVRSELLERIEEGKKQIIYLCAPTGFGKTTLASQWVSRSTGASVWLDVSRFDSEEQFLIAAVGAFKQAISGFASNLDLATIRSSEDIERAVSELTAEIAAYRREVRFVIDKADFFGVSTNQVAALFVKNMPSNVSVMVIRERQPQTATLTLLGNLNFSIIDSDQLALTTQEIMTQLALDISEPDLLTQLAKSIYEATQGWPSAVHILFERLRDIKKSSKPDAMNALENSISSGQIITIAREALARLSDEEVEILKSLIFLGQITNELAFSLTKNPNTAFILAKLATGSFYLSRVNVDPPIYELNQVMQSALRDELAQSPDRFSELHRLSFEVLFEKGPKYRAFELLAERGDVQEIRDLLRDSKVLSDISLQIRAVIYSSNLRELNIWRRYIPYLPESYQPLSFALDFYSLFIDGKFRDAKALLDEKLLTLEPKDPVRGEAERLLVFAEFALGEFKSATARTLELIERVEKEKKFQATASTFLRFGMTSALFLEDYAAMKRIAKFVNDHPVTEGFGHYQLNVICIQALLAYYEGRYRVAESLCFTALSFAKANNIYGVLAPFEACLVLIQVGAEQGEKDLVLSRFEQAKTNLQGFELLPWLVMLHSKVAIAHARMRSPREAEEIFARAREFATRPEASAELLAVVDRNELHFQVLMESYVRRDQIQERVEDTQVKRLHQAHQHLRGNKKEFEKAMARLDLSLPREALQFHVFNVIQNFEYPPVAREHLKKALDIALEHGFYEYLLIQGDRFLTFLVSSVSEIPSAFLERLAKEASERLRNKLTSADSLPVPLTRREADILRHLSSEKPLSAIAGDLNITKNTMKTHLRHLYKKLGATDRHDAVAKGKALLNL
jgi:LuxR family transcriptional regulator, maltose regulon positive regulatory protein